MARSPQQCLSDLEGSWCFVREPVDCEDFGVEPSIGHCGLQAPRCACRGREFETACTGIRDVVRSELARVSKRLADRDD